MCNLLAKKWVKILISIFLSGCVLLFAAIVIVLIIVANWLKDTPELNLDVIKNVDQTTYLYDSNSNIIATYNSEQTREWVYIDDIPLQLQQAVVATEDRRFYSHPGYDVKRIASAIINFILQKDVHGGSTISQQVIKNTILTPETTLKRKVQEVYLAIQLEDQMDKDHILECYLNIVYFGDSCYGVKSASLHYFNKDLNELSLEEITLLAGLTQNPDYYNPRNNKCNLGEDVFKERNGFRIKVVLNAMLRDKYITQEEYDQVLEKALNADIYIVPEFNSNDIYNYPQFVEFVMDDVIDGFLLQRNLPDTKNNRIKIEEEIRSGGYRIYTTLDSEIQDKMQKAIDEYKYYPDFETTKRDLSSYDILQPQVSGVVIDQHSGQIVGMIGSRKIPEIKKSLNRAVSSNMPVGSIIKPLSIYCPALDMGMSPATIEYNFADKIKGYDTEQGYPGGGLENQGPVTLRYSVEQSLNVVPVRLLCYDIGLNTSSEYLARLGINRKDIQSTGFGLALGGSGVNMLDITAAYATIANDGIYLEPRSYLYVTDRMGTVLLNSSDVKTEREVFKETTSWLMTDMLEDVVKSGTGKNASIKDMTVAGKTGTNENTSLTFAGYTPYYTSALWMGHDAFIGFKGSVESSNTVVPLWQDYMEDIHKGMTDKAIQKSTAEELGIVKATVCSISGKLATEECGDDVITDYFFKDNIPKESCDMHKRVYLCSESGYFSTDNCPEVEKSSVVIVPADSELYNITHSVVDQYLNVYWSEDEYEANLIENSCPIHTEEQALEDNPDNNSQDHVETDSEETDAQPRQTANNRDDVVIANHDGVRTAMD